MLCHIKSSSRLLRVADPRSGAVGAGHGFVAAVAGVRLGRSVLRSGIKLENASTARAKSKKRSQFRVASKNIAALYEKMETVEV